MKNKEKELEEAMEYLAATYFMYRCTMAAIKFMHKMVNGGQNDEKERTVLQSGKHTETTCAL